MPPTPETLAAPVSVPGAMSLERIRAALAAQPRVAQWQISETAARRRERYLTFLRVESDREVDSVRWQVWISLEVVDGAQGEAGFEVCAADGDADLAQRLDTALAAAAAAPNPPWTLPGPGEANAARQPADPAALADPALVADPERFLDRACAEYAAAAAAAPWVRPSTLEVFVTDSRRRLVNHRGLDLHDRVGGAYVEFVLLHRPPVGDEIEFYDRVDASSLASLRLGERVGRAAECVRAACGAPPPPSGSLPVMIAETYLEELLGFYAYHSDAAVHARKLSVLTLDRPVLERRGGDPLDLASDPTVPSARAYQFDANGYAPARQVLVARDVHVGVHGSGRWMQALGREPRGQLGTLVAPAGHLPMSELRRAPAGAPGVLEVVRFSEFSPRHDTGAFSGEIRFAWLHRPDGTRLAVTGGSVTGVLREALADARFSSELIESGGYAGPRAVRLERVTVAV